MGKLTQGERLREWRKQRKLTQKELARRLAIQQGSLAAYENNGRKPRIEIAALIERITEGEVSMRGWAA